MRTFFLAVNTGYSAFGDPTERAIEFYRERSGNNLYAAIVGNVVLPSGYGTNDVCMRISNNNAWEKLALAIRKKGAIPGVQLSSTWENYVGNKKFRPSPGVSPYEYYRVAARNFTADRIKEVFVDLRHGTDLAIAAGFRHVQLHAAHGYLFSLMLDPAFSDCVEQSLAATSDWLEFLRREGVESSIRVSITTGIPEADQGRQVALDGIFELKPDFIDISDGYYNADKHLIYPSHERVIRDRHEVSLALAQRFPAQQCIISGRASALKMAGPNLNLGLCRDLIANPDFLNGGSGCKNRMLCHFYSRGKAHLSCGEWVNGRL